MSNSSASHWSASGAWTLLTSNRWLRSSDGVPPRGWLAIAPLTGHERHSPALKESKSGPAVARAGVSGPPSAAEGSGVRLQVSMTRARGSAGRGLQVARPETSPRPSCPRWPAPTCLRYRAPREGEGSGRPRALAWSTSSPTGESRPAEGVWSDYLPWRSSALRALPGRGRHHLSDPQTLHRVGLSAGCGCGHRKAGYPHILTVSP